MITLGVDFSAQDSRTSICEIDWRQATATVERLVLGASDATLLAEFARADKVGIDVPLGWPDGFVEAISAHHAGHQWPGAFSMHELRFRKTDREVHKVTQRWPLSVSSDRIAVTAMRAGKLLGYLEAPLDRTGVGKIVEVYPAAALRIWKVPSTGYKRAENLATRKSLVASFAQQARSWLHLSPEYLGLCEQSDDAFDAIIAALVARAQAVGQCETIPADSLESARREGWIALPRSGSLQSLA